MNLELGVKASGTFKVQVLSKKKELIKESDWQNNLILDQAIDRLFFGWFAPAFLYVGTGNSTPTTSQVGLDAPFAAEGGLVASTENFLDRAPYGTFTHNAEYQFEQGSIVGNIAELGITDGDNVYLTRALIKDSLGNPTTISVAADQILRVFYSIEITIPDWFSQTVIDINGTSTTVSATNYYNSEAMAGGTGSVRGVAYDADDDITDPTVRSVIHNRSSDEPLDIWYESSDSSEVSPTSRQYDFEFSADSANFTSGISHIQVLGIRSAHCPILLQFNPRIVKSDLDVLNISLTYSVTRTT